MCTLRTWCARAPRSSSAAARARSNVFTRIALALFGQIPWRGVPYIPVEIMLLPKWFFFHLDKVSYWSRTVMVPLFILCTRKPLAKNPRNVHIRELFTTPPEQERDYFRDSRSRAAGLGRVLLVVDRSAGCHRSLDPEGDAGARDAAAEQWMLERLNGEDGLGAIFPAMVNALEVMVILGYPADDPRRVTAKRALQKLLVIGPSSAYCQPCVSPVWDTALGQPRHAGGGLQHSLAAATRALDWLQTEQLLDEPATGRSIGRRLAGGGWAFQFANDYYPDLDDTAVVAWAMHQAAQRSRLRGKRAPRARLAGGHAEQQRRICRVRRRQYLSLSEQDSLRRPWRPARSADQRRDGASGDGPRSHRPPAGQAGFGSGARLSARRTGAGRLLVRPLGDELHLRHLVGAHCARSGRHRCRRIRRCGARSSG